MTCPTPGVYVTACALERCAEVLGLTPDEVREKAWRRWSRGKGLAEVAGVLATYLHNCSARHGSIPRLTRREVWWYAVRADGGMALVTVELITRPMWEEYLRHVATAGRAEL